MDIYQTEDEQVEALKKWWQENGKSAVFGVVLGLMAIFGWREWKDYEAEQTVAASRLYQEMLVASQQNNAATVDKKASEIVAAYGSTAYAVFAKLGLAKQAAGEGDLDGAAAHLQWALDNTSQNSLRHVITLRLAGVLIAQDKPGEAKTLLGNKKASGEFSASYQELEGDVLRLEGNIDAARDAYQKALNTAQDSGQDTVILDMKIDDLGRAEAQ